MENKKNKHDLLRNIFNFFILKLLIAIIKYFSKKNTLKTILIEELKEYSDFFMTLEKVNNKKKVAENSPNFIPLIDLSTETLEVFKVLQLRINNIQLNNPTL